MVWTACPDGSIDYSSARFLEYLGIAPEQLQSCAWLESLHPDDRQRVIDAWEHALRNETEYRIEYRLRNGATGEYGWFLGHALPQRNAAGRVVRWYGTCTDVDSQWRAQQEIVRLNRDLRARVDELRRSSTRSIGMPSPRTLFAGGCRQPGLARMLGCGGLAFGRHPDERPRTTNARDARVPPEDRRCGGGGRGQPVTGPKWRSSHGQPGVPAAPRHVRRGDPRGSIGRIPDRMEAVEAALKDSEERLRLAIRRLVSASSTGTW
jgi:PAS domain S-box-containing protein